MRHFPPQPSLLSKIHNHKQAHRHATEDPWHFLTQPEKIVGFFPDNKNGRGGGITVFLSGGTHFWMPATINTVLNRLADSYLINLSSMKKRLQLRLGVTYYLPLPFSKELVLIQVKTRQSSPENEGVHGYVNACQVKSSRVCAGDIVGVEEKGALYGSESGTDHLPYLEMECGLKFPCLTSQKKVNARFRQAQMAMDELL